MKRLLGLTRYAVVIPALASILGALLLMAQGSFAMVLAVIDSIESQYGLKTGGLYRDRTYDPVIKSVLGIFRSHSNLPNSPS